MEETPGNNTGEFFGRSPPRSVRTKRINSPRNSKPPSTRVEKTNWERNVLLAINTCPPGLKACTDTLAHSIKKRRRESRSFRSRAVNLGSGARVLPSNDGGILHILPLPFDLFSIWSNSYSFYTIWRISYNRVDTVLRDSAKPLETICMHNKR